MLIGAVRGRLAAGLRHDDAASDRPPCRLCRTRVARGKVIRLHPLFAVALVLGTAASGGILSKGAAIVRHGTASGVMSCMACHGQRLQGNASIGAPALAGLPESRTLGALDAIAAGKSGDNFIMRNIAHSLTPAEREAVAAYLATLAKEKEAAP